TLHPDFQERVNTIRSYPINTSYSSLMSNAGEDDGASDKYSGHGTHVAGSIIGDGKQAEAMGLSPIKGMAPEAELIFQAIEQTPQWTTAAILYYIQHTGKMPPASGLFGIPDDLKILFDEAYKYGARIHSNSWGGGDAGAYDTQCTDLDSFVWEHKDFLILVAAGNSGLNNLPNQGIEPMSIDSPSIAKNCVAVGASENDRLNTHKDTYGQWWEKSFLHPPFYDDSMTDNINDIVAFSSRGPCKTMRRKPDVIAPGTFILSTRSSTMPSNNFAWGAFHPAKAHYMYNGGTSMATPLVAGAAALLRQYFRMRTPLGNPTAALLKAALIHSAEYCNYRYKHASSTPWADNEQGWGRVNLVNVINPAHPTRAIFFDETGGLASGDEKTYRIEIDDDSVPLRATLVYNDYPGEQLINNLNLLLFAPDGEYFFGNDFIGNKQPDTLNNVEGIVIQSPQKGVWLIRVVASNIVVGPQDFALIVSGGNARLQ
ncbi:MAG TPA: S8 family serine peptidase, partial [Pyrinomonadaceae bacterium]